MIEENCFASNHQQIQLLAKPVNRAILSIVSESEDAISVGDLTEQLVEREIDIVSSAEYTRRVKRTELSLHHNHLPKLEEANLVTYDREETLVSRSSADCELELVSQISDALKTQLETEETTDQSIGVIHGSESIVDYGRLLCDKARDELFCMYISPDLISEECLNRVKQARQRDVDVAMGSRHPVVREATRTHVPDATVWEPQLDWMHTRSVPSVARLLLADREKLLLGIIDDGANRSGTVERALVGDGVDNPLVVLVRELLGERLDHLDYQHADASAHSMNEL